MDLNRFIMGIRDIIATRRYRIYIAKLLSQTFTMLAVNRSPWLVSAMNGWAKRSSC